MKRIRPYHVLGGLSSAWFIPSSLWLSIMMWQKLFMSVPLNISVDRLYYLMVCATGSGLFWLFSLGVALEVEKEGK